MRITKYQLGDEKKILKLFEVSFGKKMSIPYWKWRFLDNPYLDNPMIYLMWENDRLIGHYAVSPNKIVIENKEYLSALSMTTMTHPEYSGKGIFTQLASELYNNESKINDLSIVWGFPNNNSHRGFLKNLNWKNVTLIPAFSLDISRFRFRDKVPVCEFKKVDNFSEFSINAYKDYQKDYPVKMAKNKSFFQWRYINNPNNDYIILEDSSKLAFMVIKIFNTEIDIVEWAIPNDFSQAKNAINSILHLFPDKNLSKINLWLPLNDNRHLDLEKIGFHYSEPITYLGFTQLSNKVKEVSTNWFFQMGDSDVY